MSSSPIVTEDEIRKTTRIAVDVAKASAIAKCVDVKLVPVPAYTDYWAVPIKDPFQVPLDEKIAFLMKVNEAVLKNKDVFRVQSAMAFDYEWSLPGDVEGSHIEQEVWRTSRGFNSIARKGRSVKSRTFNVPPRTGGYEIVENSQMLENAERIAAEAAECRCVAGAGRRQGPGMTPSHAMLTIHEIIAHPTELDRVLGYEANYAGTSFIKLADVGKLKYGSKLFNVTGDRTITAACARLAMTTMA